MIQISLLFSDRSSFRASKIGLIKCCRNLSDQKQRQSSQTKRNQRAVWRKWIVWVCSNWNKRRLCLFKLFNLNLQPFHSQMTAFHQQIPDTVGQRLNHPVLQEPAIQQMKQSPTKARCCVLFELVVQNSHRAT